MTETAVLPQMTGAKVIAEVIRKALGDAVIYSVPGSPITNIVTNLNVQNFVDYEEADMVRRLTGINSHGITTVAVMKHSGFLAVQELMAILVNHDLRAPFILVVGDEPGATSQTGNDTRYLCDSCHIPLVELSLSSISESLNFCIEVSSKLRKPVVLRVVSSLVQQQCGLLGKDSRSAKKVSYISRDSDYFASEGLTQNRYYHFKTLKEEIANSQYSEELNKLHTKRGGRDLVIAAGNIFDRVNNVVANHNGAFDLLEINTVNLLPELRIAKTLNQYSKVLVLESWDIYLEEKIRSLVQRYELTVRILGRQKVCGVPFINVVGELSDDDLVRIIKTFDSESQFLENKNSIKPRSYPFLRAKDIEKYLEIYKAFQRAASEMELEPCLSVSTGQTRYPIPGTKFEGMVKFMGAMGSETQELLGYLDFLPFEKMIAPGVILGDYTFTHSAWKGVSFLNKYWRDGGRKVVTIIIDNNGSQTTGGQGCETPEIFGSGVVKDWEKRFTGTVAINKPDEIVRAIKEMLAPTTDKNILIVDFNKGDC